MGWEEKYARDLNRSLDEERSRVEEAHRQQVDQELRKNEVLYGFVRETLEAFRRSIEALNKELSHFRLALSTPVPVSGVLIPPDSVSEFFVVVDSARTNAALRVAVETPAVVFCLGALERGPADPGFKSDESDLSRIVAERSGGWWKAMIQGEPAEPEAVVRTALEALTRRFRYEPSA